MSLFDCLGFRWDRAAVQAVLPIHAIERVCFRFQHELAQFVWEMGVLEGNPFTLPEVLTLFDGMTVGGRRLSEQDQILSLAESAQCLLDMLREERFALSKPVFSELNAIVARNVATDRGVFRAAALDRKFGDGVAALEDACAPFERALAFFVFGALQQFFHNGNKRTSRLMMNGILMANGIDALSVPARCGQAFNEKMMRFYRSREGTELMSFLAGCHPSHVSQPVAGKRAPDLIHERAA